MNLNIYIPNRKKEEPYQIGQLYIHIPVYFFEEDANYYVAMYLGKGLDANGVARDIFYDIYNAPCKLNIRQATVENWDEEKKKIQRLYKDITHTRLERSRLNMGYQLRLNGKIRMAKQDKTNLRNWYLQNLLYDNTLPRLV